MGNTTQNTEEKPIIAQSWYESMQKTAEYLGLGSGAALAVAASFNAFSQYRIMTSLATGSGRELYDGSLYVTAKDREAHSLVTNAATFKFLYSVCTFFVGATVAAYSGSVLNSKNQQEVYESKLNATVANLTNAYKSKLNATVASLNSEHESKLNATVASLNSEHESKLNATVANLTSEVDSLIKKQTITSEQDNSVKILHPDQLDGLNNYLSILFNTSVRMPPAHAQNDSQCLITSELLKDNSGSWLKSHNISDVEITRLALHLTSWCMDEPNNPFACDRLVIGAPLKIDVCGLEDLSVKPAIESPFNMGTCLKDYNDTLMNWTPIIRAAVGQTLCSRVPYISGDTFTDLIKAAKAEIRDRAFENTDTIGEHFEVDTAENQ